MLKAADHQLVKANGKKFAIVASTYNAKYVDSMLKAAEIFLTRAGSKKIRIVRVPGAYEIPVVAAKLAASKKFDAIICLGVIIRGATTHAQHIGEAVSQALSNIQVQYLTPVIHEVLLLENEQQANERCLNPQRNRGVEAAGTAIRMAVIMNEL
ncbi:MAG: 6,7-dimethyl-8-ribityllumazine synthase [Verrucomicrobiales bacterium]|nr:6,7-dimethyl-8-ribityllumazine synthase [Verrucomicrobiales bacterium]